MKETHQEFIDVLGDRLGLTELFEVAAIADESKDPAKSFQVLTSNLPFCLDAGAAVKKVTKELVNNPNGELAFAASEKNSEEVLAYLTTHDMLGHEPEIGM